MSTAERPPGASGTAEARVTVIIPSFNDGALIGETIDSIREREPVEIVVVDDASTDPATLARYPELEARGVRVLRLADNAGAGAARNAGLAEADTRYVFNLDADDLLVPGVLGRMASLLDAHPEADVSYGDYEEFGAREGLRRTAAVLDPYVVAHVNKSPGLAMFRTARLREAGGWPTQVGYEDWDLWMTLVERGCRVVHLGDVVFRYRVADGRMFSADRRNHAELYHGLRARHPALFGDLAGHRRRSPLPWGWKLAYPALYRGGRPRLERARQAVRFVVRTWSPALRR